MLKRWGRGVLVLASITCMFVLGIMMGAKLYAPNTADLLDILGFLGDLGAGLLYMIGHGLGLGRRCRWLRQTTAQSLSWSRGC